MSSRINFRPFIYGLLFLIALVMLCLAFPRAHGQEIDSTIHVKAYPGNDIATKVTNAMVNCDATLPCILVIDPSLANYPTGSMPALCPTCSIADYRSGPPTSNGLTCTGVGASRVCGSPQRITLSTGGTPRTGIDTVVTTTPTTANVLALNYIPSLPRLQVTFTATLPAGLNPYTFSGLTNVPVLNGQTLTPTLVSGTSAFFTFSTGGSALHDASDTGSASIAVPGGSGYLEVDDGSGTNANGELHLHNLVTDTCTGCGGGGGAAINKTPVWTAALTKVVKGTGNARILFTGDSTVFGVNSQASGTSNLVVASVGVDFCNDVTTYYGVKCQWNSWFGAGVSGANFGASDPRVVKGSSWAQDSSLGLSLGGWPFSATTGTNAFTFTPTTSVDTFEVYYIQQSGGGVLSVQIDSGSPTTINTSGSAALVKSVIAAGSLGAHTISYTWSSGGKVSIQGNVAYDSTHSSVIAMLAGVGAATSSTLSDMAHAYGPGNSSIFSTVGANLVYLEEGINDWDQSLALATFSANIQTIITAAKTAVSDIALVSPNPSNPAGVGVVSLAQQNTYVEAYRTLAATNDNGTATGVGLPFIDAFNMWNQNYLGNGGVVSWSGDNLVHPNGIGYQANATFAEPALLSLPSETTGHGNVTPWTPIIATAENLNFANSTTGGSYTLKGNEGGFLCAFSCTLTLPNPSGFAAGFKLPLFNYTGTMTIVCTGTCQGSPGSMSVNGESVTVFNYNSAAWYFINHYIPTGAMIDTNLLTGSSSYAIPSASSFPNGYEKVIYNFTNSASPTLSTGCANGITCTFATGQSVTIFAWNGAWYPSVNPPAGGAVTSFAVGAWPSWLIPTVVNGTTTPVLSVAAGTIPGSTGLFNGFVEQCHVISASGLGCIGDFLTNPASATYAASAANSASPMVMISASGTTSGNSAGWSGSGSFDPYYSVRQPLVTFGVSYGGSSDYTANARVQLGFVGNACTAATMSASDTAACNYAQIQSSTVRGDTFYQCVTDNASGTPTVTSIGVAPTSAFTIMSISFGASSVTCTVAGTSVTNSTHVPTGLLYPMFYNTTLTTASHQLRMDGWYGTSQNGVY